jgi:hypothetical protein
VIDVLAEIMTVRRTKAVAQARDAVARMNLTNEPLAARRALVLEFARAIDPQAFGLDRSPLAPAPKARAKKGGKP